MATQPTSLRVLLFAGCTSKHYGKTVCLSRESHLVIAKTNSTWMEHGLVDCSVDTLSMSWIRHSSTLGCSEVMPL